jgi:hypothetical protein
MIDCPRAKSAMTPCIARDGSLALTSRPEAGDSPEVQRQAFRCVGCMAYPRTLLINLAKGYAPARRYVQTKDPVAIADRLAEQVAAYVEGKDKNVDHS